MFCRLTNTILAGTNIMTYECIVLQSVYIYPSAIEKGSITFNRIEVTPSNHNNVILKDVITFTKVCFCTNNIGDNAYGLICFTVSIKGH